MHKEYSIEKEFLEDILLSTGVAITKCSEIYDTYWRKLQNFFLTEEAISWFKKRQGTYNVHRDYWLYWELFGYKGLIKGAVWDEEAIQAFEDMKVTDCYVLQPPGGVSKMIKKPAYHLVGKYDVSFINSKDDFEILEEDIRKPTAIPYRVLQRIEEEIGPELYVIDKDFTWIFIITHAPYIIFYQIKK